MTHGKVDPCAQVSSNPATSCSQEVQLAAAKKPVHKAKPTHKQRKYRRNYPGRDVKAPFSFYVLRMKARGTFRERKGIQKKFSQFRILTQITKRVHNI